MKIQVSINGKVVFEEELQPGDSCGMQVVDGEATAKKYNEEALAMFDLARQGYPGKKRGLITEFENFRKRNRDWKQELPKLFGAITAQIHDRNIKEMRREWVPSDWPLFQVWINQRRWEMEMEAPKQYDTINRQINFRQV